METPGSVLCVTEENPFVPWLQCLRSTYHMTANLPQQSNYCNCSKPYQFSFCLKFWVCFKTPKGKALPVLS